MGYIYGIYLTPPGVSSPPFWKWSIPRLRTSSFSASGRKPIFEVGAEGLVDSIPSVSSDSSIEPVTFCLLSCVTAVP